jgi:hypothetical protein
MAHMTARMSERCPFGERLVKVAEELHKQLQGEEIPEGFEPSEHYWENIASVRHEYTNYEELLYQLPSCTDFVEENEENRALCIRISEELKGGQCPWCEEAHDLLKYEERAIAVRVYDMWCKK